MGLSDLKNVPCYGSSSQTDIIQASITDGLISCSKAEALFSHSFIWIYCDILCILKKAKLGEKDRNGIIKYYNSIRNNSNPIASVQFWLNILFDLNTINSTYVQYRSPTEWKGTNFTDIRRRNHATSRKLLLNACWKKQRYKHYYLP